MLRDIADTAKALKSLNIGDFVDNLNIFWTPIILFGLSAWLIVKDYSMRPIRCVCPKEYKETWEDVLEADCLRRGGFYVPLYQAIPRTREERQMHRSNLYMWIPYILLLQGLGCLVGKIVWVFFAGKDGMAWKISALKEDDKESYSQFAEYLSKSGHGSWILYTVFKFINLLNCGVNIGAIYYYSGKLYWIMESAETNRIFPAWKYCDSYSRALGGHISEHLCPCLHEANAVCAIIFPAIAIWIMIMAAFTFLNIIYWTRLLSKRWRLDRLNQILGPSKSDDVRMFVYSKTGSLSLDAITGIMLIQIRAGSKPAEEIIRIMIKSHSENRNCDEVKVDSKKTH
ncbi:innexin domain-containing protein [Ditylenchus destructor]|nr:innexin domain-containing protein [Ditylenchus destructor]